MLWAVRHANALSLHILATLYMALDKKSSENALFHLRMAVCETGDTFYIQSTQLFRQYQLAPGTFHVKMAAPGRLDLYIVISR